MAPHLRPRLTAARPLAAVYDPHRNGFHGLRLLLACCVLWSHAYVLTGVRDPLERLTGDTSAGELAVESFFVLSGFLVTQSWVSTPRLLAWARRRAWRLLPALLVVLPFQAVCVGPLATGETLGTWLGSSWPWRQFPSVLLHGWMRVPGAFAHNPVPEHLNGSLWSLRYEIACYALLGAVGVLCWPRWRAVLAVLAVVAWGVARVVPTHFLFGLPSSLSAASRLASCFLAGALAWELRHRIPVSWLAVVAAGCALCAAAWEGDALPALWPIAGAYVLLVTGALARPIAGLGRFGDVSYGLYLYAWPIQQLLVQALGRDVRVSVLAGLGLAATMPFAVASWFLVESPALARGRAGAAPAGGAAPRRGDQLLADGRGRRSRSGGGSSGSFHWM